MPGPIRLNVGCGRNSIPGWVNLDSADLPGVQVRADLDQCATVPLPIQNDTVDEFLLSHVIEHIRSPLPLMQELHRIAKPGAVMRIDTPHGASDDAWEDPTHVKAYFPYSFGYFAQPYYHRADYGYRGDWQPEQIVLVVDGKTYGAMPPAEIYERAQKYRNVVKVMVATLRAIKPIREPRGELIVNPKIDLNLQP